jgi:23S rRNA (adenine2030-N6)-methyltransferase
VVAAELLLREPLDAARLNGAGLLVVAPPHRFEAEATDILAALAGRLGGLSGDVMRLVDE